jgi:hypothetical protein
MNISEIKQYNSKSLPTFKQEYFNKVKNLPEMVCAICGKKTLSTDLYVNTIKEIARPLNYHLKKGELDFLKNNYSKIFNKLIEFSEAFPKLSLDEILIDKKGKHDELSEVFNSSVNADFSLLNSSDARTEQRKIQKLFFDILDASRNYMKQSSTTIKCLSNIKEYLDYIKADVFEQFEIYSRKYPKKRLSEIVVLPEIYKFHSVKNFLDKMEKREKLDFHFQNIHNIIKAKKPKNIEYFDSLKEEVLKMYEIEKNNKAREYYAQEIYKKALNEHRLNTLENQVLQELDKIPKNFLSKDSFFTYAKNCKINDGQIVSSLFAPYLASEEHVHAISQGGEDVLGNLIVAHRNCNSNRGSKPYTEILQFHKDIPKHAQTQIDIITQNIENNVLPERLRTYPVSIANTLSEVSDGAIKLDIVDYCKRVIEQTNKNVSHNNKTIKELKSKKEKIKEQIRDEKIRNSYEIGVHKKLKGYLDAQE